jgi:hypothetical protein
MTDPRRVAVALMGHRLCAFCKHIEHDPVPRCSFFQSTTLPSGYRDCTSFECRDPEAGEGCVFCVHWGKPSNKAFRRWCLWNNQYVWEGHFCPRFQRKNPEPDYE